MVMKKFFVCTNKECVIFENINARHKSDLCKKCGKPLDMKEFDVVDNETLREIFG